MRDLVTSLREYAGADPLVAYHLWVLVFPIVWASLTKDQQVSLAKPITTLLAREYHHRQTNVRPNVLQVRTSRALLPLPFCRQGYCPLHFP